MKRTKQNETTKHTHKRIVVALLIVAGLLAAVGIDAFFVEPFRLTVEEATLAIPDLPPGLAGLRIAQISDTHIKAMRPYERKVQAKLAELAPDMIVVTGDLIEHVAAYEIWAERAEQVRAFLAGLGAPLGVWVSRGNTDNARYGGHSALLVERIRESGARLLINEHGELAVGGDPLYLVGADYVSLPPRFSADHTIQTVGGGKVLAAEPCEGNAFTHLMPAIWPTASVGEFSGRLNYGDPEGGTGVVFASRLPLGEDRFYRIRRLADAPIWRLSPKGVSIRSGVAEGQDQAEPGQWYAFRIRWEAQGEDTRIRARFWPEGIREPDMWEIDALVEGALSGTVGFWSVGPGWKYYDDLRYTSGEPGSAEWREDFEGYPVEGDPPHWLDFGVNKGAMAEAMRDVSDQGFSILLAHSPDAIHEAVELGADVVLSGHTHGGQVRLPWIGPLYINTDLGPEYNQGLFRFDDTWLYVNRGLGTRGLAVRLLCPPEITLLTLSQSHP